MRFFVGITDHDWFDFLSRLKGLDEVNFWQPSGQQQFRALQIGEPFLFKLHSPNDYIVGGGCFSHFTILPASIVWEAFGEKNGAQNEEEMRSRIARYRRAPNPSIADDYQIGCILLESPFFFDRADWIPLPDWKREIVRGRGYESAGDGREIWQRVEALMASSGQGERVLSIDESQPRYGDALTVFPRLGQGSFRLIVTDSYDRRCAFTNSPVLHVLEAAHIRPYSTGGTHSPANGILLRQDLHTLFDRGYMTVTPDHLIEVSSRIKEEFHNGKEYYALHGETMRLSEGPHSDTGWVNMIGIPAVVVPGGFYPGGLPFGLELSARQWKDGDLLGWAYAYEQVTGHRCPPVLVEKGLLPNAR